ncbi:hypothetical protein BU24DRAFT_359839 [Aaosphaeria arxii CBS 175.79]|uniref:Cupredoxin n=1 Tax=Aaosphaeria arxii CBS 175.79 TaxID=1450172 RepID=A0A6A5X703_9PLEO|nr:uncharacterized protein BU24DRAFT_359839 [Aaosphaeria arxii CBS 175.79]KAF2008681.1 hypothetical protein BU24DRAFT_359839 [Aaosphaeria arxii CBS 175.79]
MHFSTIFTAAAVAGSALAADITVSVGLKNGSALFNPETIKAAEGDVVKFKFWPSSHSVVAGPFARPCQPGPEGSIWSGFVTTNDTEKASPTEFHYTVTNASAPIWLYCSRAKHCQNGMVAVINPPTSGQNTLDRYRAAAAQAEQNVSPTSTTAVGGNLTTATQPSGSSTSSPGAAAGLKAPTFAVSGVVGLFAYFLL